MPLHPLISISERDRASVYVDGVCELFRVTVEEAYDFAEAVSATLWANDLRESPLAA
ncbi:hypothetical protein SEA_KEALII_45 [Arthrobacter phage KeAlii]|uniref:Uncharacterized protein n=1 Tax=Arthrobacter phage KeAlii TaxID=2885973 RepID=A0AA94WTP7_9CAUD|nr:hypothetical protein PQE15_gp45 [Arthrobacter phage KeAlii]UDL14651.1 hypothetical protein SEA_KEALII_45 [Arthrobacter phage KeAlii]